MRRHQTRSLVIAAATLAAAAYSFPSGAEQFFATQVIARIVGDSQFQFFATPEWALDGPRGGGSAFGGTNVYNLGVGGSLTLGFDSGSSRRVIRDRPGADFIVFENPIYENGDPEWSFAELMYVEVSSNGVDFARFPVTSNTPAAVPAYGTISPADVAGFAGVYPVLANVATNGISPFDPSVAGGDAFDLADLAGHPLVTSGKVNLAAIRQVRLVDVVGDGRDTDRNGRPIYDATGSGNNGADVDAVAVIHGELLSGSARLIGSAGGSFNDASRWDTGSVPGGAGASADVSSLGFNSTLSIEQGVSLARLDFGSNSNTLAGPAMLTLDGGVDLAGVFSTGGVHTISSPVQFSGDVFLSAGNGTIIFTGPLVYDSNTSLTVSGGTVEFAVQQGPVSVGENVVITITGGSTLSIGGRVNPLQDSATGQFMSMSFGTVPEPGALSCLCLFGCVLLRRRRAHFSGHAHVEAASSPLGHQESDEDVASTRICGHALRRRR